MRMLRFLGITLSLLAGAVVLGNSFITPAQAEDDRSDKGKVEKDKGKDK